jgi:hypothetical protein
MSDIRLKVNKQSHENPDWAPSLKLGPHELATPESSKKRYDRTQSRKEKKIQFNAAHALLELQVAEIDNEETLFDVEKSDQSHCTFKWMTALSNEIEPESRHFMRTYMICIMSRDIFDTQLGLTLNRYPKS